MGNTHATKRMNMSQSLSGELIATSNERLFEELSRNVRIWLPTAAIQQYSHEIKSVVRQGSNSLVLDFSDRALKDLPPWVDSCSLKRDAFELGLIQEVILTNNKLTEFPNQLEIFSAGVERLALGNNKISCIPDIIASFRNLNWLDFTHNNISNISDRIGELKNLTSLGASDCRLSEFPKSITQIENLNKLGIFNNMITEIPNEIGNLVYLTKLDLSGNLIKRLPDSIGCLTDLTWLNLSNNQLESLPETLNKCVEMRELGLANNRLQRIPDLGSMKKLVLLAAFNNQIKDVGSWVGNLKSLRKIDLSTNKLTGVPKELFKITELELVNIRSNQISDLNLPSLSTQKLSFLDVRDNLLKSLPYEIINEKLIELKADGNPFIRDQTSRRTHVPSLLDLLLKNFADTNKIEKFLPERIQRMAINQKLQCAGCFKKFRYQPVRTIEYNSSSDHVIIPFVVKYCTAKCRNFRHKHGIEQSAVFDHENHNVISVTSPR